MLNWTAWHWNCVLMLNWTAWHWNCVLMLNWTAWHWNCVLMLNWTAWHWNCVLMLNWTAWHWNCVLMLNCLNKSNKLKWKCFWKLNCVLMSDWIVWNRTICIKMDLVLNNLQRLICHKIQPTNNAFFSVVFISLIECFFPCELLKTLCIFFFS